MLTRESWQHQVALMGNATQVRVDHDCGPGRTLLVSRKPEGWSAWCFRCGEPGFIPAPTPTLSERLAALQERRSADLAASATLTLPGPREPDPQKWPLAARVWLYKAGFSNDDILRLGWYYAPRMQRVVLPVFDAGQLMYWQARALDGRQPKYLNPVVGVKPVARYGEGRVVVLTEDLLSAARVARVTEAWCLLGTSIPDRTAARIAADGRPVVFMLDPDAGGAKGVAKGVRLLRMLGCTVFVARPDRDPKYLTKERTLECLDASLPQHLRLRP